MKMTKSNNNAGTTLSVIVAAAITAALVSFVALRVSSQRTVPSHNTGGRSLYERVLQTGVIKIGYTIYPPGVIKGEDGRPRGIAVDVLNEVASRLNLKAEWAEEVGWATQIEGLDANRYDIIGTAVWPNPKRARLTTLSKPLFYTPLYLYARSNENRFPAGFDLNELNKETVRISAIEGATAET